VATIYLCGIPADQKAQGAKVCLFYLAPDGVFPQTHHCAYACALTTRFHPYLNYK